MAGYTLKLEELGVTTWPRFTGEAELPAAAAVAPYPPGRVQLALTMSLNEWEDRGRPVDVEVTL